MRRMAAVLLGCTLGLLAGEGVFRFLLFSDSALAIRWGVPLRKAGRFTNFKTDSDYFKLRYAWREFHPSPGTNTVHPKLGWLSGLILSQDLMHKDRGKLGKRRPLLMYGDSFMACMGPSEECWQGLMETTPLADELGVLNYGIRGYGLGQTYVMLEESLGHWIERDPVVAVGILVDDDLDRVVFDFRGRPKPVFGIAKGELTVDYPGDADLEEWLEAHPVDISSYLLAYIEHGTRLMPSGWSSGAAELSMGAGRKRDVSRLLLSAIRDRLEGLDLEYFVIVFEGPSPSDKSLDRTRDWRYEFLFDAMDELGMPWVSAEKELRLDLSKSGATSRSEYFVPDGQSGARHYNRRGNQVVLRAILRGLHGAFDGRIETLPRAPGRAKRREE